MFSINIIKLKQSIKDFDNQNSDASIDIIKAKVLIDELRNMFVSTANALSDLEKLINEKKI